MNVKNPLITPWQRKWLKLDVWNDGVQTMADAVEKFARGWYSNNKSSPKLLVIVGRTGCGKTHCLRAMASWARFASVSAWEAAMWPEPPSVHFCSWPELCEDFARDPKLDLIGDLVQQKLLALDDVGAEIDRWKTGEMNVKLQIALDRRSKLWTAITTNIEPSGWASRWDERIADRLLRNSMVCDVSKVGSYNVQ